MEVCVPLDADLDGLGPSRNLEGRQELHDNVLSAVGKEVLVAVYVAQVVEERRISRVRAGGILLALFPCPTHMLDQGPDAGGESLKHLEEGEKAGLSEVTTAGKSNPMTSQAAADHGLQFFPASMSAPDRRM